MVCWPSRTVMWQASSAASMGGSTMSTPTGMSDTPSSRRMSAISLAAPVKSPASGATAPLQPDHPAADVLRRQPRAVEAVVLGRRAEVPEVRLAAAGEEREARHLVAGPLPDVGARDVADVVEVEDQQGAQLRCLERLADAVESVVPQPLGVDALLPVDGLESRGADRSGGHLAAPLARSRRTGASRAGLCSGTAIVALRLKRVFHTGCLAACQRRHWPCATALEHNERGGPCGPPRGIGQGRGRVTAPRRGTVGTTTRSRRRPRDGAARLRAARRTTLGCT